jgi:hypothetical protein
MAGKKAKVRRKDVDAQWRALRAEARQRGLKGEARRRWLKGETLRRELEARRDVVRLDIKILELRLRERRYESQRLFGTVQGEKNRRFHRLQQLAGTEWGRELEENLVQLGELDYLLQRPTGRRRKPIYSQAFQELQKNRDQTIRELVLKLRPNLRDRLSRAGSAYEQKVVQDKIGVEIEKMKQGLRRERKRRIKPLPQ